MNKKIEGLKMSKKDDERIINKFEPMDKAFKIYY